MVGVRRISGIRPIAASIFFLCASCTSIASIDSPYQRRLTSVTTSTIKQSRLAAREAADQSTSAGTLIFIDPTTKSLKYALPGNSPMDAWLRYAATSKSTIIDELPLPSSFSPTAVFIPKSTEAGTAQLIYTQRLDSMVKDRYDLSSAILRLAAAVQQLRDMVILISLSDKKQNAALHKIQDDFSHLGQNVATLTAKLGQLSSDENEANAALDEQLRSLSTQLDELQNEVAKIK